MITLARAAELYPIGRDLACLNGHHAKVLGHETDEGGFLCVRVREGRAERLWPVDILAGSGVTVAAAKTAID